MTSGFTEPIEAATACPPRSAGVPAAFTASETFDVGVDLGSPVSLDYLEERPFRFEGEIEAVDVELR